MRAPTAQHVSTCFSELKGTKIILSNTLKFHTIGNSSEKWVGQGFTNCLQLSLEPGKLPNERAGDCPAHKLSLKELSTSEFVVWLLRIPDISALRWRDGWIFLNKIEMKFGWSPINQKDPFCTGCYEASSSPGAQSPLGIVLKNVLKGFFLSLVRQVHKAFIQ